MRVRTLPLLMAGILLAGVTPIAAPTPALAQHWDRGHRGPPPRPGPYRGGPGWRGDRGGHRGPGVGAAIGAGIAGLAVGALVGSALSSRAAPPPAAYYPPQQEPAAPPPAYYPQASYGPPPY